MFPDATSSGTYLHTRHTLSIKHQGGCREAEQGGPLSRERARAGPMNGGEEAVTARSRGGAPCSQDPLLRRSGKRQDSLHPYRSPFFAGTPRYALSASSRTRQAPKKKTRTMPEGRKTRKPDTAPYSLQHTDTGTQAHTHAHSCTLLHSTFSLMPHELFPRLFVTHNTHTPECAWSLSLEDTLQVRPERGSPLPYCLSLHF